MKKIAKKGPTQKRLEMLYGLSDLENLLLASIEVAVNRTPKGQGLQICEKCHTMVIDGTCWCNIGLLTDGDIEVLSAEWKERGI